MNESYWPADTSEEIRDSTIAGILREAAESGPDHIALIAGTADPRTRTRHTYAEVAAEAEAVARVLATRFSPEDRIAVLAPSIPQSYVLSFATAMARLVLVPMNPLLRTREIEHILLRSRAVAAFIVPAYRDNDLAGVLASLKLVLPELRETISFEAWPALVEEGRVAERPLPPPDPDDVAQLVFTSGTTGAPKGAMLTHRAMTNAARVAAVRFGLHPGDVYVNTIPLFHIGGQAVTFELVQAAATNVLVTQFDAGVQLELVETERATHTVGVPTTLQAVIEDPTFVRRDLSALRAVSSGGALVPVELIRHLHRALGVQTTIIFGQTETCGFISQTFLDDTPDDTSTTVGVLLPHLEGRVVDDLQGGVVPVGTVGELHVRGAGVMAGYLDEPDQTAAAIDPDGWLHTGDLVTMDERGYLRVTGRVKDMIVTGGVNVYPAEIEAVVAEHPAVAAVAVVSLPDDRWGEAVVAVVRPAPGVAADAVVLEQFTRERLAPYKVPKRWLFAEELPMTASGKVQKYLLGDMLVQELG